ncbi:MAG: hypothetical protein WCG83_01970 [Candidatus Peregrinibacteria bacterium]
MKKCLITAIGLELLAIVLAWSQSLHAVLTDEAKYLLNIPYPHPPLLRFFMELTSQWPAQEMFWRVLLATLLMQSVWIVVGFLPKTETKARIFLGALWILSLSVLSQAGAILMAPVTAMQGLIFCRILLSKKELRSATGWVTLLWLASLFTAYQAILFLPVVTAIFLRAKSPLLMKFSAVAGPMVLLALYTIGNPLVIASFVNAGTQNAGSSFGDDFLRAGMLWMVGGSLLTSVLGTYGILRSRSWALLLSMLLVFAFIVVSYRSYYAILFAPLFIAGIASVPSSVWMDVPLYWKATRWGILLLFLMNFAPSMAALRLGSSARMVSAALKETIGIPEAVAIVGSPGHEWQYELSPARVVLRSQGSNPSEEVVVCLQPCPMVSSSEDRVLLPVEGAEVWVRKG